MDIIVLHLFVLFVWVIVMVVFHMKWIDNQGNQNNLEVQTIQDLREYNLGYDLRAHIDPQVQIHHFKDTTLRFPRIG